MYILETLHALAHAIETSDCATTERLLDSVPDDIDYLLNNRPDLDVPTLREFIDNAETHDHYGIVLYHLDERPYHTIGDMECRIAEVFNVDMSLAPYAGLSIDAARDTDEMDFDEDAPAADNARRKRQAIIDNLNNATKRS